MPRQSTLVLGLAALAVALLISPPTATAQAPHKEAATAEGHPAPAAEAAHADISAAEGNPDILEPQPSLAIWTVVVFLGLLYVLGKFAWKPLLNALHQREEHLEHVLLDTERARNESERLLAEYRRQVADAEDRARALLDEARVRAKASAEEIIQLARTEAEAEKHRARQEIESARDQALTEIWAKAADLAVTTAGKVLAKELGPEDHRRLFELATHELPATINGHGSSTV